jgi:type IV pilus assembly protein PilC
VPHFHYRAARPDGSIIENTTEGDSEYSIRTNLEGQGLLILELGIPKGAGSLLSPLRRTRKPLSLREFLVFNQEFLALIKSGLPMLRSFDILTERAKSGGFQQSLQAIREGIRGGASISEAMAEQPGYFSELYRASIQSGEHSGNLPEVLQRYISYLKLIIGVREKVVNALIYPSFLVIFGVATGGFLLAFVMPTFADVYAESNTELPYATHLMLNFVNGIGSWVPWILAGLALMAGGFHWWYHTPQGKWTIHKVLLRLPLLGDVILKNQVIRLTRTLATVLAGGIPVLSALQVTAKAMTNKVFAHSLNSAMNHVREGMSLSQSLRQEGFLPRMTIEMIEVGETTGSLESMLLDVSEFHESELDLQLSRLTTWIEPVLLIGMGAFVGGIVIIMYLPIFQLAGAV